MPVPPPSLPPPPASSNVLVDAIQVAFYTNADVIIYCAAGAFAVHRGYIDGPVLRSLAGVVINILFPALTFSQFTAYSADHIARWSPVLVAALLHVVIGGLLGKFGALACGVSPPHQQLCIISVAFGNAAALPFVMIGPIVNNWSVAANEGGTTAQSTKLATGMVALYSSMWVLAFFSFGKAYIGLMREIDAPVSEKSESRDQIDVKVVWRQRVRFVANLFMEPTVAGTCLALIIGCIPPLKDALGGNSNGALRFVASSSENLGSTGVTLSTCVLGASLMMAYNAMRKSMRAPTVPVASDQSAAVVEMTALALVNQDDELLITPTSKRRRLMAFFSKLSQRQRTYLVTIALKLALMPAVCFPLTYAASRCGLLPDDPLLQIVIYMQAGVPSSQTAVSMLAALGKPKLSQELSGLYLPQYILSVFSMSACIIVAINLIGH